jgi:hypothetical protein
MTSRWCVLGLLTLFAALPLQAGQPLTLSVSPAVSFAPAILRIQATIEADTDNRAVEFTADSPDFFRSSRLPLEGDAAARTNRIEFPGLPEGDYEVTATLFGSDGQPRGQEHRSIRVVARGH